ncbi:hypothetical protein GLOTRDRAFT_110289 [Gloeophyllum trabeum ATCC 11539]|uniref:Uncharacterized protein n=1 Tax=Gloeophyllum trabeum (strain ATCC 11539 / FP-39264 / Madison 617) TaxID=670483 RepID=S7QHK2_GLOTA|nr:uncharacterized protein GLOTRDRAFT_110289 [Gloeophyllum trabeum ATCC 11539]EPQ58647.1 hypothetical protein GLOTRDRAFT_110289 [Gloeophyllum trabeum ATCC 11539]
MQLASHGLRGLPGQAASRWLSTGGPPSRSIHVHSIPRPTTTSSSGLAQTLLSKTRYLLTGFVGHLTTPGTLGRSTVPSRSLHAARPQSIQQRLSLPARYALSTPLHAPRLPKPPAVPRNVTQVGLGVVRNFSTARPIFENLVQNVPVAGRAFVEADWEIKMPEMEKAKIMMKGKGKENVKKSEEMMKPKEKKEKRVQKARKEEEYERYFPAPAPAEVTTHLYVPLAPTPSSRMPLAASGSPSRLLPLDTLAYMHSSADKHSLRVSSLFMRLDQGHVWERGVRCEAFGDPSGVCTILRVTFEGWSAQEVRGVIGESGTGWCELEECRKGEEEEMESVLSDMELSSAVMSESGYESEHVDALESPPAAEMDPAASFVLPTLDFSSTFYATSRQSVVPPTTALSSGASTPTSEVDSRFHFPLSPNELDAFSDFSDTGSERSFSSGSFVDPPSLNAPSQASSWYGGFGFSSEFASRVGMDEGPREAMF